MMLKHMITLGTFLSLLSLNSKVMVDHLFLLTVPSSSLSAGADYDGVKDDEADVRHPRFLDENQLHPLLLLWVEINGLRHMKDREMTI